MEPIDENESHPPFYVYARQRHAKIPPIWGTVLAADNFVEKFEVTTVEAGQAVQLTADMLELWPEVDGAVKSRFLMRVGWIIIVHVYFTRPTDWGIV